MTRKTLAALALMLSCAACASAPAATRTSFIDPYDYYAFDRMSRIEIAQNLTVRTATLDAAPALVAASADNRTAAHERAATRVVEASDRLRNKPAPGEGRSYYVQAQNSFSENGWVIDNNRLRHEESGLLCPSALALGEDGRNFALQRVIEFDDQSRDVACHYQASDNGDAITAYASYWPDIELEEHAVGVMQGIYQNYTVSGQTELPVVELKADEADSAVAALVNGMEEPIAGGFEIGQVNGADYRTSVWLVKTHGWHVKLRATYASADEAAEFLSAIHFMASHLAVRAKNMAEPIAPGAEF